MSRSYAQLEKVEADQPQAGYRVRSVGVDWCARGAIAGLAGGLVAALAGSLLTVISWLTANADALSYTRLTGTMLLVFTIPLLIFGAHCLDVIERRKDRRRDSRFRENL